MIVADHPDPGRMEERAVMTWASAGGVSVCAVYAWARAGEHVRRNEHVLRMRLAMPLQMLVTRVSDQAPAAEYVSADGGARCKVWLLPEGWRGQADWLEGVYKIVPAVYNMGDADLAPAPDPAPAMAPSQAPGR